MHIKLIVPAAIGADDSLVKMRKAFIPSLSISYLAGLVPEGHTVSITDERVEDIDYREPADLVGITTMSTTAERAYRIARIFRARGIKVVLGGIHASFLPEEAMANADSVVIGEAEDTWPQVIRDHAEGTMKSLYQGEGRLSLKGLPHPRFDLLRPHKYMRLPLRKSFIVPIQTARGCPHNCSFCSVTRFWGSNMRYRPVEEVVEEIKASRADTFIFTDDNLLFNPQRARELLNAIMPLKIKYICQMDTRVHAHPDLIELLGRSGCVLAFIGFESLSKNVLQSMHKGFNKPDDYRVFLKSLRKSGVGIYASLIFGNDADSPDSARDTADFLIQEKVSIAAFWALTPFPGTRLYEELKRDGRLVDEHWWLNQGVQLAIGQELITYEKGRPTGFSLREEAMRRFYSGSSILRRFVTLRPNSLMWLPMNLAVKHKMKKYGVFSM